MNGIPQLDKDNKPNRSGIESRLIDPESATCVEDWVCYSWNECIDSHQTRICEDWNQCGTPDQKPIETRDCIPEIIEESVVEVPESEDVKELKKLKKK